MTSFCLLASRACDWYRDIHTGKTYCDDLNENGHHELIFLNVRSQIGGAIQKGLGGVGLLVVRP